MATSPSRSAPKPVVASAAHKVCCTCGVNVADKPRVKDEMGRYWCKPCVAKAELDAAQKDAATPDETRAGADIPASGGGMAGPRSSPNIFDGGDEALDLASAAKYEAIAAPAELPREASCPSCKQYMAKEARICIHCGYDRQRKMRLKTTVEKAVDADGAGKRKRSGGDFAGGGALRTGLGVFGILAAIAGAVPWFMSESLGAFAICAIFIGVASLVGFVVSVACQFRDGEVGWGVATLATIIIGLSGFIATIWAVFFSSRQWLAYLAGGAFVGSASITTFMYFGPGRTLLER
jgi:hypothetical protein